MLPKYFYYVKAPSFIKVDNAWPLYTIPAALQKMYDTSFRSNKRIISLR